MQEVLGYMIVWKYVRSNINCGSNYFLLLPNGLFISKKTPTIYLFRRGHYHILLKCNTCCNTQSAAVNLCKVHFRETNALWYMEHLGLLTAITPSSH